MASKELFAQVEQIIWRDRARVIPSRSTDLANEILATILAALREPTPAMQLVVSANWGRRTWAEYQQVLNASPLGEQSE
ncbi:hypothetical protein [Brucella sp.]|uniref:hypothetical protein n=1 Tax=Brucella sp. TaxID=52132 RepID=UPI0028AF118A|nr:hypothetical protein [Brucella sp.]